MTKSAEQNPNYGPARKRQKRETTDDSTRSLLSKGLNASQIGRVHLKDHRRRVFLLERTGKLVPVLNNRKPVLRHTALNQSPGKGAGTGTQLNHWRME